MKRPEPMRFTPRKSLLFILLLVAAFLVVAEAVRIVTTFLVAVFLGDPNPMLSRVAAAFGVGVAVCLFYVIGRRYSYQDFIQFLERRRNKEN